jgi:hypothetical protein
VLETLNEWHADATDFVRRYGAWRRNDVEKVLNRPTGAPAGRVDLANLIADADQMAKEARSRLAQPDSASPDHAALKRDLTRIAGELEKAVEEGSAVVHPDTVWSSADHQTKLKLTQKIPIPKQKADLLRARLRGDLHEQAPPDDDGKPKK